MNIIPGMTVQQIETAILENETVVFSSGRYFIDQPICLNGVRNRRIIGEKGAVLCGGTAEKLDWTPCEPHVYRTQVGANRRMDGICVGKKMFRMARYPHAGNRDEIYQGWAADCLDFAAKSAHPEDGFIHALHAHMWGDFHYRITGVGDDGSLQYEGGWQNNRRMGMHEEYRFVENLREALGADGEYFYDPRSGELFIFSEEEPEGKTVLIDNVSLFRMENCENIRFESMTFAATMRTFMEEYEPLLRSDWTIHRNGALFVENSSQICFSRCEFHHLGSNALFFSGNVSDCHVSQCCFHDLGASGICFVGKPSAVRYPFTEVDAASSILTDEQMKGVGPCSDEYVRDCSVENTLIRDSGQTEKQTACVEISMSARISVSHCTLHTCPRAAINISEGTFGGHIIEYNDVFDTVRETGDHGSFNGWGRDRFWHATNIPAEKYREFALMDAVETTILRNNRMRCDHGWDIDLDDGCSNYIVEDNLCLNGGLKFREGFQRIARRNILINNTFHSHAWYPDSGDIVENNLLMRPYLPYMMPERWGECVNRNVLAVDNADGTQPAVQLQRISGQDGESLSMVVHFDENLRPTNPEIAQWFSEPQSYGVYSEELKKYADVCPVKTPRPMPAYEASKSLLLNGMEFKAIDNDGEMSLYAAPGHHGIIVLDLPEDHPWHADGLKRNTAVIRFNGKLIDDADHFMALYEALEEGEKIVMNIRDMENGAYEVLTKK